MPCIIRKLFSKSKRGGKETSQASPSPGPTSHSQVESPPDYEEIFPQIPPESPYLNQRFWKAMDWTAHFQLDWFREKLTATLLFKTTSLSSLMRSNLTITEANIVRAAGFMGAVSPQEHPRGFGMGYRYKRVYCLVDLGSSPQWMAKLYVFATTQEQLRDFRVLCLHHKAVSIAHAWNPKDPRSGFKFYENEVDRRRGLYYYRRREPRDSYFNTVLDDMPLSGLWPWPRRDDEDLPAG